MSHFPLVALCDLVELALALALQPFPTQIRGLGPVEAVHGLVLARRQVVFGPLLDTFFELGLAVSGADDDSLEDVLWVVLGAWCVLGVPLSILSERGPLGRESHLTTSDLVLTFGSVPIWAYFLLFAFKDHGCEGDLGTWVELAVCQLLAPVYGLVPVSWTRHPLLRTCKLIGEVTILPLVCETIRLSLRNMDLWLTPGYPKMLLHALPSTHHLRHCGSLRLTDLHRPISHRKSRHRLDTALPTSFLAGKGGRAVRVSRVRS